VVLLDFGLVLEPEISLHATDSTDIVGTAAYMAPEQASGTLVGPEADWYSVGVLLYEALTGRLPYQGQPLQIMMAKQNEPCVRPRALIPWVPADLDDLCVRLLAAIPTERATLADFLAVVGGKSKETTETVPEYLAPPSASRKQAMFEGREPELHILEQAFERSRHRQGVLQIVTGESGVGKTALVRHFARKATNSHGAVVLFGRCFERESTPYKGFDGIVDALSGYLATRSISEVAAILPLRARLLAQIFPVLRRVQAFSELASGVDVEDPQERRARAFAALRELFARLAERVPVILVIDDLQWIDADGVVLLSHLLSSPDEPPLLLLATQRTRNKEDVAGLPIIDPRPSCMETIHLGTLPSDIAQSLARNLLPTNCADSEGVASFVANEAGGHPLFIHAIASHIAFEGTHAKSRFTLDELLWRHVSRLEPPIRGIVELTCIAGAPVSLETIAKVTEASNVEIMDRVAVLSAAQIVKLSPARVLEPYHDRITASVMERLSEVERCSWHRRLALVLEAEIDPDPERLAFHWCQSGNRARAVTQALLAAERAAAACAFDTASRLYQMAIDFAPNAQAEHKRAWMTKKAESLANAGRGAEAAHAYTLAVLGAPSLEASVNRRRAVEQFLRSGLIDEGLAALHEMLSSINARLASTPRRAFISLLFYRLKLRLRGIGFTPRRADQVPPKLLERTDTYWTVAMGLAMVDIIRGSDFQARAILSALETGEPCRIARALSLEICYVATQGSRAYRRSAWLTARAMEIARKVEDPHTLGWFYSTAGICAYLEGRWRSARASCENAEQILREHCTGVVWELNVNQLFSILALTMLGEIAELSRRVPLLLREARERGDLFGAINLCGGLANMTWLAADDPQRAVQEACALEHWSHQGFHLQHSDNLFALVQIDLYKGDGLAAHARLMEKWRLLQQSLLMRIQKIRIDFYHLRARAAIAAARMLPPGSQRTCLLGQAKQDTRRVMREKVAWAKPLAEITQAALQMFEGRVDVACETLRRAADHFDAADMALHAESTRFRLGHLIGKDAGRPYVLKAETWMASQRIRNPSRMVDLLVVFP
jgi:tetratricopeptide (TPR) repeat protein